MFPYLLPKTVPFFDFLRSQNDLLRSIAKLLLNSLEDASIAEKNHKEIALLELEADKLHGKILRELSRAFITPIDREDILLIDQHQENCIDCLQRFETRMHLFEFQRIRFPMMRLATLVHQMLELTLQMLNGLEEHRDCHKTTAFRELREEADMILSAGLGELMDESRDLSGQDVLRALKWMQMYDRMERLLERISDLSEAVEGAVLKYV